MNTNQLQKKVSELEGRLGSFRIWAEKAAELEQRIIDEGSTGLEVTHVQLSTQKKIQIPASADLLIQIENLEEILDQIKLHLAALS